MNANAITRRTGLTLLGASLSLPAGAQPTAPALREGYHYRRLPTRLPSTSGKVDVVEFFWYGCPHCYAFEPVLGPWVKQLPPEVEFRHVHVFFGERTRAHQRLFFTLQAMGVEHQFRAAVFKAIHEQGNALDSPEAVLKLLQPQGLDAAKFNASWISFDPRGFGAGRAQIQAANRLAEAYGLDGVPSVGIGGLFLTSPGMATRGEQVTEAESARRSLRVMDALIKQVPKA